MTATPDDADPNVLPFTSADYLVVADAQPRLARLGGHVSINAEAPDGYPEAGYIVVAPPQEGPVAARRPGGPRGHEVHLHSTTIS